MKILLNLGCGNRITGPMNANWIVINHDLLKHRPEVDVCYDLNHRPWPWINDSVTIINAWQVLEHLRMTLPESFDECWRILKPGGKLTLNVPLWSAERAHDDPTHRHFVTERTLEFLDPETEKGARFAHIYGYKPWRILKQEITGDGASLWADMEPRK